MKVLLLGARGMLGHDLKQELLNYELFAFDRDDLDITNKGKLKEIIYKISPAITINCAVYRDVDGCEINKKFAFNVNGHAVGNLAEICNKTNSSLVHISSDYVFYGNSRTGYMENSKPNPINTYGKSKLLGETLLKKGTKKYFLIRTAWLYGEHGKNFVKTIVEKAKKEKTLHVVDDEYGSPTYTKDLAKKIISVMLTNPYGTYHLTNSGNCSRFEFAKEILKLANRKNKVIPISSKDIRKLASRPKKSILLNTKLTPLRHWKKALKAYFLDLK